MAASTVFNCLLLLGLIYSATIAAASSSSSSYTKYIKTSCSKTTYPSLCYRNLSPHATTVRSNPWKLCSTALSISVQSARNASSIISKLLKKSGLTKIEASVIRDCVDNLGYSIDELKLSIKTMDKVSKQRSSSSLAAPPSSASYVELQISNVKTWVSAAVTDEYTCTDGVDEEKMSASLKKKIRTSIVVVARLTSNSLSLIHTIRY